MANKKKDKRIINHVVILLEKTSTEICNRGEVVGNKHIISAEYVRTLFFRVI